MAKPASLLIEKIIVEKDSARIFDALKKQIGDIVRPKGLEFFLKREKTFWGTFLSLHLIRKETATTGFPAVSPTLEPAAMEKAAEEMRKKLPALLQKIESPREKPAPAVLSFDAQQHLDAATREQRFGNIPLRLLFEMNGQKHDEIIPAFLKILEKNNVQIKAEFFHGKKAAAITFDKSKWRLPVPDKWEDKKEILINPYADTLAQTAGLKRELGSLMEEFKKIQSTATIPVEKRGEELYFAAALGKKDLAETLLLLGADMNWKAPHGATPLMAACYQGEKEIANLLIQAGAQLDVEDAFLDTAVTRAAQKGHGDIIEALFNAGATVPAPNSFNGQTLENAAKLYGARNIPLKKHSSPKK